MLSRREALGAMGVAVLGSTAGCSAIPFLGDDPIEFGAKRASVPQSTRSETGYEENDIAETRIERTFKVGGQSQDVVVTNWQAEYDRAIDLAETGLPGGERVQAAVFTVLSTPQVSVLGRTFNPVGDMDSEDLAEMVQDRYDGVEDVERVGEDTAIVAGQPTTVGEFLTGAELVETGATVELALHIAEAVETGGDFVVAVGGYPSVLGAVEADNVFAMMEAIEHGG